MESNRDHSVDKNDKTLPWSHNDDEDTATMAYKLFQLNKIVASKDQKIIELTALNQKLTEQNHKFLQDIIEIIELRIKNLKEYKKLMNIQKANTQLVRQKPVQAKMKGVYSSKTQGNTRDCSSDNNKMKNCKFFSKQKCKYGDKCIFIHNTQQNIQLQISKEPELSLEPESHNSLNL